MDPTAPTTLYAGASDRGVFKSTDAGVTWNAIDTGIAGNVIQVLAIDPANPQILYAATGQGIAPGAVYKTVNGGSSWSVVDSSATGQALQIAVDAQNPNNVYTVWDTVGARKSTDAGVTWNAMPFPGTSIASLALDPHVSGNIFAYSAPIEVFKQAGTPAYIWHSTDGGASWTQIASPSPIAPGWTIDGSSTPPTIYNGLSDRSSNGGASWTMLPASVVTGGDTSAVAVEASGTLYAAVYSAGMYVSHDQGQSWTATGSPVPPSDGYGQLPNILEIAPVGASGTLYAAVQNYQTSAFVTKLSPDGSSIVFSTFLNGHESMAPVLTYAAEPGVFGTQNWISAIALDSANNVVVAGGTRSADFPTANPLQRLNAGNAKEVAKAASQLGFRWEAGNTVEVDPGYRTSVQLLKYNYSLLFFRYLAGITFASHTGFTYHRTWETGLGEVTRVSSSNPLSLCGVFPDWNSIACLLSSPTPENDFEDPTPSRAKRCPLV